MLIKTASEVITAPEKDSKTKLATKSNFYKWHRIFGLTALVSVIHQQNTFQQN